MRSVPELDEDALLSIFMHLPASSLMSVMSCSRGWRALVRQSHVLWRQKLREDFHVFDNSRLADVAQSGDGITVDERAADRDVMFSFYAKSVYFSAHEAILRGEVEATCELLNPNMCEGKFASAFLCKVKYDREVGALRLQNTTPGLHHVNRYTGSAGGRRPSSRYDDSRDEAPVLASRLRRASFNNLHFAPPMPSFAVLREGEVVELQWKKSRESKQYAWWFALVGRVVSDDVVELVFPQYGTSASSALTQMSAIHRTRGAEMHGGLAGGVRQVGAAEAAQWWTALAGEDFDRVGAAALVGVRQSKPSRWEYISDLVCIREVFTRHLPARAIRRSMEIAGASASEIDHLEQRIEASREARRGKIRGRTKEERRKEDRRADLGASFVDFPLLETLRLRDD